MSHEKKYLKYKNKYLSLKQSGGYKLKCPSVDQVECDAPTRYMGMCVNNETKCDDIYDETKGVIPEILWDEEHDKDLIERYKHGISKGYIDDYLHKSCLTQTQPARIIKEGKGMDVFGPFSVLTLNVMGITRDDNDKTKKNKDPNKIKFAEMRVELLLKDEILEKNPDILCFQEMSQEFLDFLYSGDIKIKYPYVYENKINLEGKDIDCCVLSKFEPEKVTMQNLDGILGYCNTLQIIEFQNLVIFNCYLQAGSKASPGQSMKWKHYSRCRAQYFEYIKSLMYKYENKGIILLGDLNFNLNGTVEEWPEKKYLDALDLQDSWTETHPLTEPGLTEDTNKNFLRWNSKFEKKEYRYDAILCNDLLIPIESTIFGDKSVKIIGDDNEYYEKIILKNVLDERIIKYTYLNENQVKNQYDLFISDHFGVLSTFKWALLR
jgi:exonuclease III